jgi:hypothetical protein
MSVRGRERGGGERERRKRRERRERERRGEECRLRTKNLPNGFWWTKYSNFSFSLSFSLPSWLGSLAVERLSLPKGFLLSLSFPVS